MNTPGSLLFSLAVTFGMTSLLAIGGANSTIPEMHRLAVDVHHWMSDAQFADMFAISQLSPGPNVLIVTLIGFHVAGFAGAGIATLAMCGPSAMFAYIVSNMFARAAHSPWPAIFQSALVPLSIGLMCASGYVLIGTADHSWVGYAITLLAAAAAIATRLNPLWALAIGGCLGFAGVV
ncbi:MAG: chromate transporter [Bradyrhizobiaceae bacterium]|nr:MAG: chromate transporter [Bradyrhizobiaceae bacterium]